MTILALVTGDRGVGWVSQDTSAGPYLTGSGAALQR